MKIERKRVDQYFKSYPKHEILYFTSDGCCFLERESAQKHATAKKINAFEVKRNGAATLLGSEVVEPVETPNLANEALAGIDLTDIKSVNYKAVLAIAKQLELTLENEKKETVIAALIAAKETTTNKTKE